MPKRKMMFLSMLMTCAMIAGCQETENTTPPVEKTDPNAVSVAPVEVHTHPAVFKDLDHKAATALAAAEEKILLVDCMTSWCKPCKMMDKTVWVEDEVVSWMDGRMIAIQIDRDQHKQLVDIQMGVKGYPTLIAFRNGEEIGRHVGGMNVQGTMTWLRSLPGTTQDDV